MKEEEFGTTADYVGAFAALLAKGIHHNHRALLRAHLAATEHATTWENLAKAVGYTNGPSVNLQYGLLAEAVARQLGLTEKPHDPNGQAWWLWALVRWGENPDPESRHTVFVLRRPVVEALQQLGIGPADGCD